MADLHPQRPGIQVLSVTRPTLGLLSFSVPNAHPQGQLLQAGLCLARLPELGRAILPLRRHVARAAPGERRRRRQQRRHRVVPVHELGRPVGCWQPYVLGDDAEAGSNEGCAMGDGAHAKRLRRKMDRVQELGIV